jgi:hypothetical protein
MADKPISLAKAMTERSRRGEAAREEGPRLEAPLGESPLKFAPEPTGEMRAGAE